MPFRSRHSEGSLAGRHYKDIRIGGHSRVHLGDAHYRYEGTESGVRSSTIAKQEAILEHLYHPDMDRRATTIHNLKQSACKWAFEPLKTTLGPWLEQEGGIFWITGKAGSGKSTFMKFLARHPDTQELLNRLAASNSLVVAEHYFWYPTTNNLQRNFEGLLRSLLYAVLCKIPEAIATLFPMRWARAGQRLPARWTEEELLCALRELSALQHTCFVFFIDGLDEYVPSRDHGTLVRELESLASNKTMKLCVASRPWQTFETHFGNFRHRLALHDFTISDMKSYISAKLIEAEIDTGLGTSFHDHEREADAFVNDLAQKAEGVFLWAVLIVRSLCQEIEAGRGVRDLQRYVDETPLDLKTFFTTMIVERIDHRNQSAVARLLKCATLLAEAHMAAVKDADMLDLGDGNVHMSFLNFSILTDSDEAEQPDFASQVQVQPLYIADMKVMLEKTQRYIGRMSRDLLHIPLDRDIDDDDLDVRDMEVTDLDELSQVWGVLANMRVEFLHRAVLDYLLDADVQYLLNHRVPSHFHRPDFLARITLARLKFYPKLRLCEAFPELVPAGMQDISMVEDLHRLTDSWTPRDREDLETYLNGAYVEQDVENCLELDTYFIVGVESLMSSIFSERWVPHICYRARSPDLSLNLLAGYEEVALTWDRYAHARPWTTTDFCTLLVSFGLTQYVRQQFKRKPRDDEFAEAMMQEAVLSLVYDPTTPSHASTLAFLLEHEQVRRTWVTQCDASTATAHQGWWPLVLYLWAGFVDASRLESATGDALLENEALEVLRNHIYSVAYALCQQGYDVFLCSARHIADPQAYIGAKLSLLRDCEQQEQHLTFAELLDNIERKTCLENLLKESRLN